MRPLRRRRETTPDLTEFMPPVQPGTEPTGPAISSESVWVPPELVEPPGAHRWGWLRRHRPGSMAVFAIGFLFLLGAVVAAGFAHFTASRIAPWLSIGYSGAAVICTVLAVATGRER